MNILKTFVLFCSFYLSFAEVKAQDFLGTWEGKNEYSFGWMQPLRVVLELYSETDSTVYGASHLYYKNNKYEHYNLSGTIDKVSQTIRVSEVSELSINLGILHQNSAGTYYLKLNCNDTLCTLDGKWKVNKPVMMAARSINTYFWKSKAKKVEENQVPVTATEKPVLPEELQRVQDIQSLVEVDSKKTDSIHIRIYDNGDIDGDFISLYLDDSILVHKQKITTDPIAIDIATAQLGSISKLKLIAESLGTIPPCTALMIVSMGKKRYEINLSSDFKKNAVVEFFLK